MNNKEKKVQLPEEILKLVAEAELKDTQELSDIVEEVKKERKGIWDVSKDDPVDFFDANLSYELTGYRPINATQGLDFDPSWFTEVRENFLKTGHYTSFRKGTKAYADFWTLQYIYCRDGMTSHGYTITGDNYFFLNFYLLANLETAKLGEGRLMSFPTFYVALYEWFHYLELAKRLRLNAVLMKARGVGFSEMDASLAVNTYSCRRNSNVIIAANKSNYTEDTCNKAWSAMSFINDYTDGGFFKLRQVVDKADRKRASYYKIINGQKVETGWMSQIIGITADSPNKIRGQRCDILLYEEAGSWPNVMTAFIQGDALVGILGLRFGIKVAGGTGGDSGPALEGLRDMYYNPDTYDILKYKHNFTPTGEETLSAFFIPAHKIIKQEGFMDNRGFTDLEKGKEYYLKERAKRASSPQALVKWSAEYCLNAEEAFSLEGDNKFNKVMIAELLTRIRALKLCPPIDTGNMKFTYKNSKDRKFEGGNILDVLFEKIQAGKVLILEHPLWLTPEKKDAESGEILEKPIARTNNLYVAGVDGIDIGGEQTSTDTKDPSDFCMVIYLRVYGMRSPKFVAIYKDRPLSLIEAYKTAIGLAMYYNCMINIEATRLSLLTWARSNKFLNYFMRRPSATYQDITKRKTNQYGTPATLAIIEHLTDLIRDYIDEYGEEIWFENMLDELNRYTIENKRKFDIIAAMGMAMLADEELTGVTPKAVHSEDDVFEDFGYYYDENGIKRFGIIPKQTSKFTTNFNPYINTNEYSYGQFKTSDPRYYW